MSLLTPQELREATERDFKAAFRNSGHVVSDEEVKRIALSSLELVEAAERAGHVTTGSRPKAERNPNAPPRDRTALQDAFADRGVHEASGDRVKYRAIHGRPQMTGERWGYACGRINRILSGIGAATTFGAAVKNAEVPRLAKKFADLWGWFLTRDMPPPPIGKVDPNPFRHLAPSDAGRKFVRLVEDICDESTGVLGSWYTK